MDAENCEDENMMLQVHDEVHKRNQKLKQQVSKLNVLKLVCVQKSMHATFLFAPSRFAKI